MTSTILVLVAVLLGSSAETAPAGTGTPSPQQAPDDAESRDAKPLGATIFVDPDTGELTADPSPGQVRNLLELGRRAARERQEAGPPPREAPTFVTPVGLGAALDERFAHSLRVRRTTDGELRFYCTDAAHSHASPGADAPDAPGAEPEPRR